MTTPTYKKVASIVGKIPLDGIHNAPIIKDEPVLSITCSIVV